jgi:hypothetical protein
MTGVAVNRSKERRAFSTTSVSAGWIQYGRVATVVASIPQTMARTRGWISIEALGPMMCAPNSRPVPRSAKTLQKPSSSCIAHPNATSEYAAMPQA